MIFSVYGYLFTCFRCKVFFGTKVLKMSVHLAQLCVALLIFDCCKATSSLSCPDFNNVDVCDDMRHVGRLQMSFGECNEIITPHKARREPVVKYRDADEVLIRRYVVKRRRVKCGRAAVNG